MLLEPGFNDRRHTKHCDKAKTNPNPNPNPDPDPNLNPLPLPLPLSLPLPLPLSPYPSPSLSDEAFCAVGPGPEKFPTASMFGDTDDVRDDLNAVKCAATW